MTRRHRTAAVAALACLAACDGTDDIGDARDVIIEHYRVPCVGVGPALCLLETDPATGTSQIRHDGIDGFAPRWGVRSRIRFHVVEIDDPPADGSSLRAVLDMIVSEEQVAAGTAFTLRFPADPGVTPDSGFLTGSPPRAIALGSGMRLDCVSDELCAAIWDRAQSGAGYQLQCHHGAVPADSVVADTLQ